MHDMWARGIACEIFKILFTLIYFHSIITYTRLRRNILFNSFNILCTFDTVISFANIFIHTHTHVFKILCIHVVIFCRENDLANLAKPKVVTYFSHRCLFSPSLAPESIRIHLHIWSMRLCDYFLEWLFLLVSHKNVYIFTHLFKKK